MMGGIETDLDARSTIAGLYAVGEASCTGLHGANRLASNSLSECLVFAARAVSDALSRDATLPEPATTADGTLERLREQPAPPLADAATREALWHNAGIVRTADELSRLLECEHPLAQMVARCALERRESRGAHLRADYPARDPMCDRRHIVIDGAGALDWQTWH